MIAYVRISYLLNIFLKYLLSFEGERESTSEERAEREENRGFEEGSALTKESLKWGSNSQTMRS